VDIADIMGAERGGRLGAPFFQRCREAPLRLSYLVFALLCLKANEPPWNRTLWSKSYVFQNKAKMCARGAFNNCNV